MAEQPLQRLDPNVAVAVPKLGQRGGSERELRKWWQSLVNEPL
jgi:hypothetical protein